MAERDRPSAKPDREPRRARDPRRADVRSEAHEEISPRPGQPVVTETKIASAQRVPGTPLLYQDDADNLAMLAEERRDHVDPEVPLPPRDVPTVTPQENAEARLNIVPDGPGTCGEPFAVGPL